jgi:hypothetical protein
MRTIPLLLAAFFCFVVVFNVESVPAATVTDTYDQLEATISAPDALPPDTEFSLYVKGEILGGGIV